ncbi:MAG: hypothetical protein ACK5LW_04715, partial [Pseudanabaena sp.]
FFLFILLRQSQIIFFIFLGVWGGGPPPPTTSTQCVSPIHTKGRSRNELTIAVNIVMLQN